MFPLGSAHLPNSQGSCSLHQNSCLILDQDPTLYQTLCPPISFPKLEAVSSQHQTLVPTFLVTGLWCLSTPWRLTSECCLGEEGLRV